MKNCISIFLLSIYLTGCFTIYKPNAVQSPMLKEKGDLILSGSLGLVSTGLLNVQSSYALDNHTGVMVNGMLHSRVETRDSLKEVLNIYSTELAIGYFDKLKNKDDDVQFHCYVGGGLGSSKDVMSGNVNLNNPPKVASRYYNCFVQPGITFFGSGVDVGVDLKANYVRLKYFNSDIFNSYNLWPDEWMSHDTALSFMNIEPAVSLRFGNEKFKAITQMGFTLPVINSQNYFTVNTQSLFFVTMLKFSVGVGYNLNVSSAQKNKPKSKKPTI